jgi:hypothetical protein
MSDGETTDTAAEKVTDTGAAAAESVGVTADDGGKGVSAKTVAVVAGTGAAVAGIAGGIAAAGRDTRRRVLGVPIGKRSRLQEAAGSVVEKVEQPAQWVGSRLTSRRSG